ncbi:hypothetical protein FOG51_02604 [Hanseniaspora uvarum]|nr:hypothetical protein FOG51_02604 [Hanseniaspora uvarum]
MKKAIEFTKELCDVTKISTLKKTHFGKNVPNYLPAFKVATPSRLLPNGKYQKPIKKIVFEYSDKETSSDLLREYILNNHTLQKFIDEHKYIEWQFDNSAELPNIKFYYLATANSDASGIKDGMKQRSLEKITEHADITKELAAGLSERGFGAYKYRKNVGVISDKLSIRGVWSPFHAK